MHDQRSKFIDAWLLQEWDMTRLCREFGISRKTGYKWLERYDAGGRPGLANRSRAPLSHPHAVPAQQVGLLLEVRATHPTWGPLKLLAWLKKRHPEQTWPAASTVGDLLRRQGLSAPRRPSARTTPPYTQPFMTCRAANDVWCADFKGWFRMGNGQLCHPFTLTDAYSRYVLRIEARPNTRGGGIQPALRAVFREYGLPVAIRTDNGAPFASTGLGGLSRLDVWWIKLGIHHERIKPGCPQQNGRHERMHRTLKAETTRPPERDQATQQRRFKRFRQCFNEERPHAALEYRTPEEVFTASWNGIALRPYPRRLPELEYPDSLSLRRVRSNGEIKWKGALIYVSEVLKGEIVGLQEIADEQWQLHFGPVPLAVRDRDNERWLDPSVPSPPTGAKPGRKVESN